MLPRSRRNCGGCVRGGGAPGRQNYLHLRSPSLHAKLLAPRRLSRTVGSSAFGQLCATGRSASPRCLKVGTNVSCYERAPSPARLTSRGTGPLGRYPASRLLGTPRICALPPSLLWSSTGLYDVGNVAAIARSADSLGLGSMHVINTAKAKFKASARAASGSDKW